MWSNEPHDAFLDSVKKLHQLKAAASQRQRTTSNPKQFVPPKPLFPQYKVSVQGMSSISFYFIETLNIFVMLTYIVGAQMLLIVLD